MDSFAENIGMTFCQLSDRFNLSGWFGDTCNQPQQFGYILLIAFVVAAVLVWMARPNKY